MTVLSFRTSVLEQRRTASMKKFTFGVLATLAGCTGSDPSVEILGSANQAVTTAPTAPIRRPRPAPRRKVASGSAGGGAEGGSGAAATGWHPLVNQPQTFYPGTSLLLTDGTVLVQDAGGTDWWKLTPDATGSYLNGTWTQLASPPGGYSPLYFGSAVLPDGRGIVEGGEDQSS